MRIVRFIGHALLGAGAIVTYGSAGAAENGAPADEWYYVALAITGLIMLWVGWQISKRIHKL